MSQTPEPAQAATLARHAINRCEKALGPEHAEVARTLALLSAIYTAAGDATNAQCCAQHAAVILAVAAKSSSS